MNKGMQEGYVFSYVARYRVRSTSVSVAVSRECTQGQNVFGSFRDWTYDGVIH